MDNEFLGCVTYRSPSCYFFNNFTTMTNIYCAFIQFVKINRKIINRRFMNRVILCITDIDRIFCNEAYTNFNSKRKYLFTDDANDFA